MKAVRAHKRGGPEVLRYEDVPVPEVAASEVLVEVHAAAVTPGELAWDETWQTADGADRTPVVPNHSLRRTFAALLYEAGESPKYVMEQMGDSDPKLALEICAKVIRSERKSTGERTDALVRGEAIEVLSDPPLALET